MLSRSSFILFYRCGDDSVDLDFYAEDGDAVCDYACGGNDDMICGGYLTFTAYDIGQS